MARISGVSLVLSIFALALSASMIPITVMTKTHNSTLIRELQESQVSVLDRLDRLDAIAGIPAQAPAPV